MDNAEDGSTGGVFARHKRAMLVAVAVLALAMMAVQSMNPLTKEARTYAENIATASVGIYVTLRTLNAVLSTAQEVEVGGSFVVSGTIQPLKGLEPIDDTIERVAGVVFFVMIATGVLAVALGPVGSVGWGMIAMACLLLLLPGRWQFPVLGRHLGWYGGLMALAVPLSFVLADLGADRMTRNVWETHSAVIDDITGSVETAASEEDANGWFSLIPDDVEQYTVIAGNILDRADELIASYVAVLSVFVFKVLVLPALLLGGLYIVFTGLGRRAFG